MQNLKADSVLFLTRDGATELDRSAAKLFARCDVDCRQVTQGPVGRADQREVDVLIHGHSETISEIKSSEVAGRLENAIRQASDAKVRYLQWVEQGITEGTKGPGVGDGRDAHPSGTIHDDPSGLNYHSPH